MSLQEKMLSIILHKNLNLGCMECLYHKYYDYPMSHCKLWSGKSEKVNILKQRHSNADMKLSLHETVLILVEA